MSRDLRGDAPRAETDALNPMIALRRRFGGTVSNVLSDPSCRRFSTPDLEGLIGYRTSMGCYVAVGDPISPPTQAAALAERFRAHCSESGVSTVVSCASAELTRRLSEAHGYAGLEFGEQLVFDPRRDPLAGRAGRELRKKVKRARREGVAVHEYRPGHDDPAIAASMDQVAQAWLAGRRGAQMYIAPLELFAETRGRRWFYAQADGRVVGALSLLELAARGGWLLEHLAWRPTAPSGTSEALVAAALERLGEEGYGWASFGPAPLDRLGLLYNVAGYSELLARGVFDMAGRLFAFSTRSRYRRKFQPVDSEPLFLLFHPARFGLAETHALLRAFNFSLTSRPRDAAGQDDTPPSSRAA